MAAKLYGAGLVLLLKMLFLLCLFLGCRTRFPESQELSPSPVPAPELSPAEAAQARHFLDLLQENSPSSRQALAEALEEQSRPLMDQTDHTSAMVRELTAYAIKALRVGGDKLCSGQDKITVFRGTKEKFVTRTKDGKPFQLARYFLQDSPTHFAHGFRRFAEPVVAGPGMSGEPAAVPYDFVALASRHSREVKLALSPFISTTHSFAMAGSFGDAVIEMQLCPGRIPSASDQSWSEKEMLAYLFVLPDEVVAVHGREDAGQLARSLPLERCYAPDAGVGSRAHAKAVDGETFEGWNQSLLAMLEQERKSGHTSNWAVHIAKTLDACVCADLNRKKVRVFLRDPSTEQRSPPYRQEQECLDEPGFKTRPLVAIVAPEALLTASASSGAGAGSSGVSSCLLKRGDTFFVSSVEAEADNYKVVVGDADLNTQAASCAPLGNTWFIKKSDVWLDPEL